METETSTIPCNYCRVVMDYDTWVEELGMCLDCSNAYWSHEDDGHECSYGCMVEFQARLSGVNNE